MTFTDCAKLWTGKRIEISIVLFEKWVSDKEFVYDYLLYEKGRRERGVLTFEFRGAPSWQLKPRNLYSVNFWEHNNLNLKFSLLSFSVFFLLIIKIYIYILVLHYISKNYLIDKMVLFFTQNLVIIYIVFNIIIY